MCPATMAAHPPPQKAIPPTPSPHAAGKQNLHKHTCSVTLPFYVYLPTFTQLSPLKIDRSLQTAHRLGKQKNHHSNLI